MIPTPTNLKLADGRVYTARQEAAQSKERLTAFFHCL